MGKKNHFLTKIIGDPPVGLTFELDGVCGYGLGTHAKF